jgi:hypothetical protein
LVKAQQLNLFRALWPGAQTGCAVQFVSRKLAAFTPDWGHNYACFFGEEANALFVTYDGPLACRVFKVQHNVQEHVLVRMADRFSPNDLAKDACNRGQLA